MLNIIIWRENMKISLNKIYSTTFVSCLDICSSYYNDGGKFLLSVKAIVAEVSDVAPGSFVISCHDYILRSRKSMCLIILSKL